MTALRALENLEQLARREDRRLKAGNLGDMRITGDEHVSARGARERHEIVVARIARQTGFDFDGILDDDSVVAELSHELLRIPRIDTTADLLVRKHSIELGEQRGRHDDVELAGAPSIEDSAGRPSGS
jgi:hypothetical protein